MGKINNIILMLEYLNTGNKYTTKELAKKLNITERMVRYYKDELEKAGIYIETFMGSNGGYYLMNEINHYTKFNKYDIQLLERANKELNNINFKYKDKFNMMLEKVKMISKIEEEKAKFIDNIDERNENEIIRYIKKSIKEKGKIIILYEDISGEVNKRKIHPLQCFTYKDKFFVTAFCELRNDIRHFEIERIKKLANDHID